MPVFEYCRWILFQTLNNPIKPAERGKNDKYRFKSGYPITHI